MRVGAAAGDDHVAAYDARPIAAEGGEERPWVAPQELERPPAEKAQARERPKPRHAKACDRESLAQGIRLDNDRLERLRYVADAPVSALAEIGERDGAEPGPLAGAVLEIEADIGEPAARERDLDIVEARSQRLAAARDASPSRPPQRS